jgi:hypothetical protein
MLGHVQALLQIPGASLLWGGVELPRHSIPSTFGAIEPTAVFVPLAELVKPEHYALCTTEIFGPFQVRERERKRERQRQRGRERDRDREEERETEAERKRERQRQRRRERDRDREEERLKGEPRARETALPKTDGVDSPT